MLIVSCGYRATAAEHALVMLTVGVGQRLPHDRAASALDRSPNAWHRHQHRQISSRWPGRVLVHRAASDNNKLVLVF